MLQKNLLFTVLILFHFLSCSAQRNAVQQTAVLEQINLLRSQGCKCGRKYMPPAPPMKWNRNLELSAQRHADDMARRNYFSHTGKNGSSIGQRAKAAGYQWRSIAENIAWGYYSARAAVESWKESPGHCRNMMNSSYLEVGMAHNGKYWVQVLGKRD